MSGAKGPEQTGAAGKQRTPKAVWGFVSSIGRAIRFVWAADPVRVVVTFLLVFAQGILGPALLWGTKELIDAVVLSPGAGAGDGTVGHSSAVVGPLLIVVALWLLRVILPRIASYHQILLGSRVELYIRTRILEKVCACDLAFFDDSARHDAVARAVSETRRSIMVVTGLSSFLEQVVGVGGSFVILARFSPLVPVLLALVTVPEALLQTRISSRWWRMVSDRANDRRLAEYFAGLMSSRDGAAETRLFGLGPHFLERCRTLLDGFIAQDALLQVKQRTVGVVLSLFPWAIGAASAYYIARSASQGVITAGDLTMYLGAIPGVWGAVRTVLGSATNVYENSLFLRNVVDFLDLDPATIPGALRPPKKDGGPVLGPVRPLTKGIEFKHVSFRYPGTDHDVLQDVSFSVEPGSTVALVGQNGAGKTTVSRLIARLYDPTEGTVTLDGRDLGDYDLEHLRSQIGTLCQDFGRYSLTVRENVGFGDVLHLGDELRLQDAAVRAGAMPLIEKLEHGWDTRLGREFAKSPVDLSVGQWQTLALARAVMRDSQILILDEPTASLDALAEQDLYQAFARLSEGRITVLVSHRFSTVRLADHIVVLEEGRVVEQGNHEQLLAAEGLYARMFRAQASMYQDAPRNGG